MLIQPMKLVQSLHSHSLLLVQPLYKSGEEKNLGLDSYEIRNYVVRFIGLHLLRRLNVLVYFKLWEAVLMLAD